MILFCFVTDWLCTPHRLIASPSLIIFDLVTIINAYILRDFPRESIGEWLVVIVNKKLPGPSTSLAEGLIQVLQKKKS